MKFFRVLRSKSHGDLIGPGVHPFTVIRRKNEEAQSREKVQMSCKGRRPCSPPRTSPANFIRKTSGAALRLGSKWPKGRLHQPISDRLSSSLRRIKENPSARLPNLEHVLVLTGVFKQPLFDSVLSPDLRRATRLLRYMLIQSMRPSKWPGPTPRIRFRYPSTKFTRSFEGPRQAVKLGSLLEKVPVINRWI